MIANERIISYINSLSTEDTPFLTELEKWALKERVPIIRKETQSFLKMLLVMKQPEHILEIGTAVGFSSLMMSECVSENCTITTIENYEKRIPIARENFVRAGKDHQITLLEGDAMEVLKRLTGPYDFVFLDAATAQYIYYLPELLRIMPEGAVLVWKYCGVPFRSRAA